MIEHGVQAERLGIDVFSLGEHHRDDFLVTELGLDRVELNFDTAGVPHGRTTRSLELIGTDFPLCANSLPHTATHPPPTRNTTNREPIS